MLYSIVFGVILGAVLGSFSCCQAWRIRLKAEGKKDPGKRSVCLHCGKKLTWKENIPIFSWVFQKGKCKKCGKKIGTAEIFSEVAGAVAFGLLGWKFSEINVLEAVPTIQAGIVVVFTTILMALAIYDAKWRELPTGLLIAVVVIGAVYVCINILFNGGEIFSVLGAVGILGGIYYILYMVSKERLVGGGDWILGLSIGLLIGGWWLSIWILFLSNFFGAIVMLPLKQKKIAFGPFLVAAFVLVFVFSEFFLGLRQGF